MEGARLFQARAAGSTEAASRGQEEATISTRAFLPNTDIYETEDALNVVMEMPGVEKSNVEVGIEDGVLKVYGRIDFSKYECSVSRNTISVTTRGAFAYRARSTRPRSGRK